jgi:hypothetical protein
MQTIEVEHSRLIAVAYELGLDGSSLSVASEAARRRSRVLRNWETAFSDPRPSHQPRR